MISTEVEEPKERRTLSAASAGLEQPLTSWVFFPEPFVEYVTLKIEDMVFPRFFIG